LALIFLAIFSASSSENFSMSKPAAWPAKARGNYVMWQSDCNSRALVRNGDFLHPMDGREVWHIAKSVALWTWRKFDLAASDRRFHEKQAYRSAAAHRARWAITRKGRRAHD
jgi:hypothetical protein